MFPADWQHTVSAVVTTTTADDFGDSTPTTRNVRVTGVLYAPEGITEAPGSPVVGEASLYGDFPLLDADDTVTHARSCCNGSLFPLGSWQVVGGAKGWAPGKVVVPIRRTGTT